jgi:hypothetical protein
MTRVIAVSRFASLGLFALVTASAPLFAQGPRSPRADSIDARKRASKMQNWFEYIRRANLPVRFSDGGSPCDARVGRFCQWNDRDTDPPKEPKPIREARDALLRSLDSAAARSPADDWIAGQRIRYLIEARRDSDALRIAQSCTGTRWWCDALRGLALHEVADYAAADTAFRAALAEMPAKQRCVWTDLSPLLDDNQRKKFGKVGCGKNEQLAERLWWLSDPLLAVPGNDRQTEHYARHVMNRIIEGTRAGYSVSWGDDLRELVVRYGWSRYWSRAPGSAFDPFDGAVSGHEATPNYHFFPATTKVDSISDIGDSTWEFDDQRSTERYSPGIAAEFGGLDAQLALFRRGDSVQVVATYDLTRDTALVSPAVHAALVLQRDEHEQPIISESHDIRGWFSLTMDNKPRLISFESWNPEKKRGGRTRRSVSLAPQRLGMVSVSDILLFDGSSTQANDLSAILPLALGTLSVDGTKKLGLYWETYGLARPDSALPVSLTLSRIPTGLRKLVESIGLGKRSTPMSIAWHETPALGSVSTRSVVLDLSLIPRGRYRLKLELTPKVGPPVTSVRTIEIL